MVNAKLEKTIGFANDANIAVREVNETCERCSAVDCEVRAAKPVILRQQQKLQMARQRLEKLIAQA